MLEFSFIRKLVVLIVLTSFVSVNLHFVAGQNTGHYQVQIENDYHGDSLNLRHITSTLTSDVETFEICGRGENGGDGCLSVNPSHHYFRVVDQSENHIGNQHHVVIENTGIHSWLRLQVDLCWSHNMVSVPIMDNEGTTVVEYQTTHNLLCKDEGTFYEGEKMVLPVFFLRSDTYFVKVTGIPGKDNDRTTIKVSATLVANSNVDRAEPESIEIDQRYNRKVCQNGCEDGNEDPVDVFSVNSHEGDTLKIQIWARGHQGVCEDGWFESNEYKVQFYWREERRMATHQNPVFIHMDESQCSNPHTIEHRMGATGDMWFYFMAKGNPEDKRSTSYALEVSIDDSTRNYAADFDQDGWNDWEENTCGTDFEDQENTPQDTDSDGICDPRDPDDDNDGTPDFFDSCPRSVGEDWDKDGCDDGEDDDDDNDGWEDISDDCQFSNMTMVAQGIDTDSDGCYDEEDPDADGDGYSNEHDALPLIFSQWNDTDGDGFGDDIQGFEGDSCPVAWGNSTEDRFGCLDADGDGWSNLNDAFVNDSSQHKDSDGDGYGDFSSGTDPDYCALEPGNSTVEPFLGCPDGDGDGWADLADPCPSSSSCWKGLLSNQFNPSSHATDIAALCVLSLLLISQFRKPKEFVERPSSLALERTKQGDTILVRENATRIRQNYLGLESVSFEGKYELNDLTLVQLKACLKSLNLPITGKKSELVERLVVAVDTAEEPLEELRVAQIKEQLQALKQPTDGNKSELIVRLRSAINSGENPLEGLKVGQLKDHLRSLGLSLTGPRTDLEQRLLEAINGSDG